MMPEQEPIDMILHCPNCGKQHVDAPEPDICECGHREGDHPEDFTDPCCEISPDGRRCMCREFKAAWLNPPHKSHLCHGCGTVWRPADVPTNGVEKIGTRGEKDTWPISGKGVI